MTNEIQVNTSAPAQKKLRKVASLERKKARAGWFFVLPFLIGMVFIYLPIVVNSIRFSLGSVLGSEYTFSGIAYYQEAFADAEYVQVLITGLKQLLFDVPAIVIFSLFMAVLLNQKMFGRAAFRAIFFIPVIICTGIIGQVDADNALINSMGSGGTIDTGAEENSASQIISATDLSALFDSMAIGSELATYVTTLVNDIYNIINRSGVQMLIYLAGLQSISGAIYESCSIDGASAWETFWKITLPMVSPMILVNTVYTVIDSFTSSTNTVMRKVDAAYADVMNYSDSFAVSTAMAWIYFAIIIVAIGLVMLLLKTFIFYQRKE
jgi:ABC-type sugar transport system permease subunit